MGFSEREREKGKGQMRRGEREIYSISIIAKYIQSQTEKFPKTC